MKHKVMALALILMTMTFGALAQTYEYKYLNINGLQIYGCEVYIKNDEEIIGTNINNINRYSYSYKKEKLLINYNAGALDINSSGISQLVISIKRNEIEKLLTNFQNVRNKCSFATRQ